MGIHDDDFTRLRHELRTSLNHIMGYSDILEEDAREYERQDIIPDLRDIRENGERIRDYISGAMNPESDQIAGLTADVVKTTLYRHLYEIIGTTQRVRKNFENDETGYFILDLDRILVASNKMLDLVDNRLVDYFLVSGCEDDPIKDTLTIRTGRTLFEGSLPEEKRSEKGRILLVDDNEMNREMLSRHLERQGHSIIDAENGFSALAILSRESIDLIILDIMMPGMNGFQVLARIKSDRTLRHIPVIMISALDDIDSVIRCIEMGAEDYLPKSFDPVLLRARIEASLEKKRLRDQEQVYIRTILESQRVLAGELADAAEYVRDLLPPFLEGPMKTEWVFVPSAQLGGDSFGYHRMNESNIAIYLLDVSGHGIRAALLSVAVMNVLRTQGLPETDFFDPSMVLSGLNANFKMDNQNNMFFSIWYGVYNITHRTLRFAAAGAPPGVLISPANGNRGIQAGSDRQITIERLGTEDMIIGINEDVVYHTKVAQVPPSSRLYLFSDGAYEIRRTNGKMLSLDEFIDILSLQFCRKDQSALQSVLDQIQGIAMRGSFEDDVSILETRFD